MQAYYGLTRLVLVYYWLTRCTGLPWYTLNGVTSGLTPYLFNRVALWSTHYRVTLWAYSGLTLSSLSLVYPMAYPLRLLSPLSLLPSLPLSVPPLQIHQLAYAVTLISSLCVYRGAHSFNSWFTLWLTNNG